MARKLDIQGIEKWKKTEKSKNRREEEKKRIRAVYGENSNVEIIPAKKEENTDIVKHIRVAAYCRVSTYDEAQSGSFELQIQHYKETIKNNPEYELVNIYSDEGVSGTSIKKRIGFQNMIEDCKAGKIDLILTKSVSRFARNTRDCLDVVRKLKSLSPPVGIYFESENLNTIESKNEFTLGVMSLVAQGESEQKSAAIMWSIMERFKKGIPIISTHNLLGYDKDKYGNIIIEQDEAQVIRYIYECYLDGQSVRDIANSLTNQNVPTVRGGHTWSSSTVRNILKNEKYCGDVLMQKTYTIDCFSHKVMKNTGQRPQYYRRNHHPPIISRENWMKVQKMLVTPRKSAKKKVRLLQQHFRPLKIKTGSFKSFIILDMTWGSNEIEQLFKEYRKEE